MMHEEKITRLSFTVQSSLVSNHLYCHYQYFQQTHVEAFIQADPYIEYNSPQLQPRTRIILPTSISCSFLHILGEELASDKVDQLGLCAEHGNGGSCKAQRPNADVNQPCHPTLIAAEECL